VRNVALGLVVLVASAMTGLMASSQEMPNTAGETLSGKRIVLAEQVRGHAVVLVAGFSHEAGNGTGAWVKAIHADPALASVIVYEIAEIAGAPSLIRGMIKSGMKKGVPAAEQDYFVVLTEDAKPWQSYFEVGDDQVPYVMLLDPSGKILWHGHGSASGLETQLKAALH
jgi:hypothetical protein